MITQRYVNEICYKIVGCAIEVHKILGPGLLESIYEKCLIEELKSQNLKVKSQVIIPIFYKGKDLNTFLKVDLLVNELVIAELKAVENMIPLYNAQLLSHLRLTVKPKRIINKF